jgi:hypothetical protein
VANQHKKVYHPQGANFKRSKNHDGLLQTAPLEAWQGA